jgi:hypothetical protein
MMRRAILVLSVLIALVAACGGQGAATTGPGASVGPGGQPNDTPVPPAVEPGGAGTAIAHAEVASGPLAGTYDETSPKFDCNTSGDGSGATYLNLAKTEGLSGLTFVSGEGGGSPAAFYFQAIFADPAAGINPPVLEIQTLTGIDPRGSGTARLEDKGGTIKWSMDGTTADGIGIKATIECGPVDRR